MTLNYHKIDPVDHQRTARQHAGETFTYGANAPGLAGAGVAVLALIVGLLALATRHLSAGLTAVILAVVLGVASAVWLRRTHRRVRDAELAWHTENADRPAPPPSS